MRMFGGWFGVVLCDFGGFVGFSQVCINIARYWLFCFLSLDRFCGDKKV